MHSGVLFASKSEAVERHGELETEKWHAHNGTLERALRPRCATVGRGHYRAIKVISLRAEGNLHLACGSLKLRALCASPLTELSGCRGGGEGGE